MGKYLNPFTDFGFKRLFGREVCKILLITFLNDLLVGQRHIKKLSFINKEIQPEQRDGRTVIFDVLCEEEDGTLFIVEMQNAAQKNFLERGLYYICRMISEQGRKGREWEYELCPVYGIYFLNFKISPLHKLRTDVNLCDAADGSIISDKLHQVFLCLPYFELEADECQTDFERWIYILKHMETLERMPFKAQKAVFSKLLDVADVSTLSRKERLRYEEALKGYRDYHATMDYAEERGIKKVARAMKLKGMDITSIAEITQLSPEEIEKL